MEYSELSFFFAIALSYVTFGLAIYAIAGLVALMWIHRKTGTPRPLLRDLYIAYASIVGLILLDACHQLWNSFHADHFSFEVSRILLPPLYLLMGNTLVSIASFTYPQTWFPQAKEDVGQQNQAGV